MQGYLTLATGNKFYLELAVNLALSLKLNDPTRAVCLVTDQKMEIPEAYHPYFNDVVRLNAKPGFHGCLNKLRVHKISPFTETMFIDSDCILIKKDMDRHWSKFQAPGFSIAGGKVTDGSWYEFSIADVIEKLGIPYMVKMNSGVFYFRNGNESDEFFATALNFVERHKNILGTMHRNKLQLADEPFIGASLGALSLEPISYTPKEGSIMITTINCSNVAFDPIAQTSQITRHDDYRLFGKFFPRTDVPHSPTIAHFVKLKPKQLYNNISKQLRDHFGIPQVKF